MAEVKLGVDAHELHKKTPKPGEDEIHAGDPANRAVLQALKLDAPVSLDQLVETLDGTSPSEIIAILFELELAGLVRQMPGKSFLRVWAG